MNILVLGGGGREHALAWALSKSPRCTGLFVAPGNGGTAHIAKNVKTLDVEDGAAVAALSASASRFGFCRNVVISALTSTTASRMPQAAINRPKG